jgi:small subunit ribosomal protein S20
MGSQQGLSERNLDKFYPECRGFYYTEQLDLNRLNRLRRGHAIPSCHDNDMPRPRRHAFSRLTPTAFAKKIGGSIFYRIHEVQALANIASAKKRAIQSEKHRAHNAALRSRLRTYIRKVLLAVESGNVEEAQAAFRAAVPIIDSSVNKGLIHKNKAARSKSRLNARVKALALQNAA